VAMEILYLPTLVHFSPQGRGPQLASGGYVSSQAADTVPPFLRKSKGTGADNSLTEQGVAARLSPRGLGLYSPRGIRMGGSKSRPPGEALFSGFLRDGPCGGAFPAWPVLRRRRSIHFGGSFGGVSLFGPAGALNPPGPLNTCPPTAPLAPGTPAGAPPPQAPPGADGALPTEGFGGGVPGCGLRRAPPSSPDRVWAPVVTSVAGGRVNSSPKWP
jgi:hypothetical protein